MVKLNVDIYSSNFNGLGYFCFFLLYDYYVYERLRTMRFICVWSMRGCLLYNFDSHLIRIRFYFFAVHWYRTQRLHPLKNY